MLKRLLRQREMINIYKRIFRSEDGEKVLSDLMEMCGMQRSSFDVDPQKMSFYEGQRSVVLRILKTINVTEKELDTWFKHRENDLLETEEQL